MNKQLFSLLATAALVFFSTPCFADTKLTIADIGHRAEELLQRGDFQALDDAEAAFIRTDARVQGGNSALYYWFSALSASTAQGGYDYTSSVPPDVKQAQLERWLADRPKSAAAHIALAEMWKVRAWQIRGSAVASKLDLATVAHFQRGLRKADSYLSEAGTTNDPHRDYILMELAQGFGYSRVKQDAIYREAIRRFPTYYHYYSLRTTILLPRWYGERGEQEAFVQSLAARPRNDTMRVAYTYAAYKLLRFESRENLLKDTGLDWQAIREGYDARERLYGLRPRDWNALCALAVAARDPAFAKMALSHIGENWDPSVWESKTYFDSVAAWIRQNS